jgi:hypothetical protein
MGDCNLFGGFSSDVNFDGAFTITDFLNNLWNLFLVPGEFYATLVRVFVGDFFEMTCSSHESWFWIGVSLLTWLQVVFFIFGSIYMLFDKVRKARQARSVSSGGH